MDSTIITTWRIDWGIPLWFGHSTDMDIVKASKEDQTKEYYADLENINWVLSEHLIIYTNENMLEGRKVSAGLYTNNDRH